MLMFITARFPAVHAAVSTGEKGAPTGLLGDRMIQLLVIALGLHIAVQIGTGTWMTSYLKERIALPVTGSMTILSVYWAGMAAGRFICSRISQRVSHYALLLTMAVGSCFFLLMSLLTNSPELLLALFALMGFSLSGYYPMLMVLGGGLYKNRASKVIGMIAAGGSISSALLQWAMSLIAEASSIRIGLFFFAALAGLSILATMAVIRRARRAGYQSAAPA
jgi:fucose permease